MDLDNENGEETPTVTTEKVAETESSSIQELTDVKDVADSIKVLDSTEAEAKNILNEISVNPECSPKVENDETAQSPVPDDKLCLETDIGDSNTPQENEKALDPVVSSPHSSGSEGSLREINLGDEKASEHFEVIDNSNLSEASNDNLIESRAAPETLVSGEVSEELNVAILGSPQKVENASSVEQAIGDEKASEHFEVIDNSNLSEASNDNLIESGAAPETVVSEKVSEELNVAILGSPEKIENARSVEQAAGDFGQDVSGDAKDIKIENEDDNINTNALEKMEEEGESSSAPKTENDVLDEKVEETNHPSDAEELIKSNKLEKKNNDEDEDNKSSAVSVIDTSIFPKPPIGRVDNVVVANCFELDEVSKTESHNEFDPADHFTPSGFEISDMLETTDSKSAFPGPSDDREDISDEELDLESNIQNTHGGLESNPVPRSNNPMGGFDLEPIVNKSDNLSLHSSDVGDIIDLKLEDAALKSIGSSCDKVSNEDLEAVSDDELPNASHVADVVLNQNTSTNLLDDREEVSSSEDEEMDKPQHLDATPISSEDEFPSHNDDEVSAIESEQGFVASAQETESHSRIESLEAEPISDEEDNNIVSEEPGRQETSFDDGEAGEIKSPALGSPISEQGDLILGEVEPVSADESQDTDGELPSGDEAEKGGDKDGNDKKFESIDSDEDIPGDNRSKDETEASKRIKDKGGYMETISDEENLDCEDSGKREGSSSSPVVEAVGKEESQSQVEKGRIPTSFNEHQVELDYEEGYGEDGGGDARTESKDDESKSESKLTGIEDGECEDRDQGLASDKDEGELSDDDCEEGEIKEPGQRKMFVKPICRFFQRGHCTWGVSCRFLHPGVNDKGNYQMIEIPGFKPVGIHARLGVASQYPEQQPPPQEEVELPPPPMPDVPHVETAWERGLRIAKEQRKKASERKEKEPDFEEKRLNLSVEEDRELNKENERTPRIIPKDPYYDQQAYEVDEYYKIPRDPWHTGHYENFEVRYHHPQNSYSPPYREKPPSAPPPMRYTRPLSPPIDKFGRNRDERPEPPDRHHEPMRVSDFPPPVAKHPDEWIDPWRRSKSPKQRKPRSRSRGRKTRRSLSDSSDSSRSSHSSSGSSRSSRSGSSSSSSRSRSPEPAPPGVDRMDRHDRYGGDQPRSMVSVRGPDGRGSGGGYNRNNNEFRYGRGNQGFSSSYSRGGGSSAFGGGGDGRNPYHSRQDNYRGGRGGGGGPGGYNNYRGGYGHRGGGGGGGGPYNSRDPRGRYPGGRNMSPSRGGRGPTPDRPLPYTRPRPKSRSSSRSSSSRSRSRSRSKSSDSSNSRSSSNSSRSSSSSSSSAGSADSDHLYRDLGSPSKANRHPASQKKRPGMDNRKDSRNAKSNHHMSSSSQSASRHPPPPSGMDGRVPHPPRSPPHSRSSGGDPKYSQIPLPPPSSSSSASRSDSKYASRNAPQPPVKAKDPLKVVGQKSNIKLTLLPKQQQQSNLGDRPNPLASPPHKRRMSERDQSPPSPPPPTKRPNLTIQASSLRMATDKAAKLQMRLDKAKSPPPGSLPPPPSSTSSSSSFAQRSKNPPPPPSTSPQKQLTSKSRPSGESVSSKPATKAPSGGSAPSSNPTGAKSKKSMSSRREELLKQLKAVEDAIARKKFKMS